MKGQITMNRVVLIQQYQDHEKVMTKQAQTIHDVGSPTGCLVYRVQTTLAVETNRL